MVGAFYIHMGFIAAAHRVKQALRVAGRAGEVSRIIDDQSRDGDLRRIAQTIGGRVVKTPLR